jgi:hypothetical protein
VKAAYERVHVFLTRDVPSVRLWAGAAGSGSAFFAGRRNRWPAFPPKVKRIIVLLMHGGPSSVDTFDPKPRLTKDDGKPITFKRGLTFGEDAVMGLWGRLGDLGNTARVEFRSVSWVGIFWLRSERWAGAGEAAGETAGELLRAATVPRDVVP